MPFCISWSRSFLLAASRCRSADRSAACRVSSAVDDVTPPPIPISRCRWTSAMRSHAPPSAPLSCRLWAAARSSMEARMASSKAPRAICIVTCKLKHTVCKCASLGGSSVAKERKSLACSTASLRRPSPKLKETSASFTAALKDRSWLRAFSAASLTLALHELSLGLMRLKWMRMQCAHYKLWCALGKTPLALLGQLTSWITAIQSMLYVVQCCYKQFVAFWKNDCPIVAGCKVTKSLAGIPRRCFARTLVRKEDITAIWSA